MALNDRVLITKSLLDMMADNFKKVHNLDYNPTLKEMIDFANSEIRLPNYEGEYVVIPKTVQQVLETNEKSMEKDLTVKAIPYSETANASGGKTVTIGDTIMTNDGLSLAFE